MMNKKVLAAALASLCVSGTALAVEIAPGGKGDLLVAPVFMTGGGWTTELKVINTNTVDSAVAKVVFHGPVNSEELLDFLVFLSPGDVWTATVRMNADGTVGVQSSDDSSLVVPSQANGCPSATASSVGFDPNVARFTVPHTTGYVKVFQTRMMRNLGAAPVPKSALLAAYAAACSANTPFGAADTDNVLTGSVKLAHPGSGNQLSLPMLAFANYDNLAYHTVGALTSFANNPSLTNKAQLEDAMWARDWAIPFNNGANQLSFATVTFPTKETYNLSAGTQYSPFPGAPTVTYEVRNEAEERLGTVGCAFSPCPPGTNLTLPNELNIVAISNGGNVANSTAAQIFTQAYNKGWVRAQIQSEPSTVRSNLNYNNFGMNGAPAIVTYINWDHNGGSLQGSWMYAPSTFTPGAY